MTYTKKSQIDAINKILEALDAFKKAGWTSPSIMIHGVDLDVLRKHYSENFVISSMAVYHDHSDTTGAILTGEFKDIEGVTLFHKKSNQGDR